MPKPAKKIARSAKTHTSTTKTDKRGVSSAKKRKITERESRSPPAKKTKKPTKKETDKPAKTHTSGVGKAGSDLDLLLYMNDKNWKEKIEEVLAADEKLNNIFRDIEKGLSQAYKQKKTIFPPKETIFNAFHLTPINKLKVVILGQDPYHDDGQAMGLAFSVPKGIAPPPSLKNIYKEMKIEYPEFTPPDHGSLERWAEQGVLLLNATLTVEAHQPNSHAKIGWQKFTDAVIKIINNHCKGVVFILWGGFAQKKGKIIDGSKHVIINTAHPSPLSFNKFLNCGCFIKANDALKKAGQSPIDWTDL